MEKVHKNFLDENNTEDLFLHPIFLDDREHPVKSKISLLFLYSFTTKTGICFSLFHQDSIDKISKEELLDALDRIPGRIFTLDKKSLIQQVPINSVLDINLGLHLTGNKIIDTKEFQTEAYRFIYNNFYKFHNLNRVIPYVKHKEFVESIFKHISKENKNVIYSEEYYKRINSEIIQPLAEIESNGIFVDPEMFEKHFKTKPEKFVYSQYNIHTSTGRPSNRFGGINYSALNKEDGSRECFISRFGKDGRLMLMDYSAFHPRIISELTNFKLKEHDFYRYMAKLCFKKVDIDDKDIKDVKLLTFRQLYGGIEDEYSHIQYFYNLKTFIETNWSKFNEVGYVLTPIFGRKIYKSQISDPNPNKLFNYILQATETEIAVPILGQVNDLLRNKVSKPVLYTYDSILFDISLDEYQFFVNDVVNLMKNENRFPIKIYIGKSYFDLEEI